MLLLSKYIYKFALFFFFNYFFCQAPPYISTVPTSAVAFSPYLNAAIPTVPVAGTGSEATVVSTQVPGVVPTAMPGTAQQKVTRADRLEVRLYNVFKN